MLKLNLRWSRRRRNEEQKEEKKEKKEKMKKKKKKKKKKKREKCPSWPFGCAMSDPTRARIHQHFPAMLKDS